MAAAKQRSLLFGACLSVCAFPLGATDPLSAIEWLEKRPKQIIVPLETLNPPKIDEPAVAGSVVTPEITVTPLGAPVRAAAGLLPSSVTGLPRELWRGSETQDLTALLTALNVENQPALQSLFFTLLLAESDPPQDARNATFMRARIEKLLHLGALDPAQALLSRADPTHRDLFDLYFDVALLSGDAEAPCASLRQTPALSSDYARRIYCDALGQNWDNAALTLATADAIGAIEARDVTLLERYLDPELFSDIPDAPQKPTPLQFRLFEAIGEPLPTASLPRTFTATELTGDAGWKSQLDAAERLARVGAISENRLLGIYTSRIPSASGGIWDRIEAVQRLETALNSGDPRAILKQLPKAWSKMQEARLEVPFATLFAEALLRLPSAGSDADLITRIALLSPIYEQAVGRKSTDATLNAALSLAIGEPTQVASIALSQTIETVFSGTSIPENLSKMSQDNRLGEAILRAMSQAAIGANGDPSALISGLSFLRSVGLEDTVRRTSLQLLLLADRDQR